MKIYTRITLSDKTPNDLDDTFTLVSDSQDIAEIESYFGQVLTDESFGSFFVKIGDGDYDTVYGCVHFVPATYDMLWLVEMIHDM